MVVGLAEGVRRRNYSGSPETLAGKGGPAGPNVAAAKRSPSAPYEGQPTQGTFKALPSSPPPTSGGFRVDGAGGFWHSSGVVVRTRYAITGATGFLDLRSREWVGETPAFRFNLPRQALPPL